MAVCGWQQWHSSSPHQPAQVMLSPAPPFGKLKPFWRHDHASRCGPNHWKAEEIAVPLNKTWDSERCRVRSEKQNKTFAPFPEHSRMLGFVLTALRRISLFLLQRENQDSGRCLVTQSIFQRVKKWNQVYKPQSIWDAFKLILNSLTRVSVY